MWESKDIQREERKREQENQKIYNAKLQEQETYKLWFDVGIKRYTTIPAPRSDQAWLWFDVGIKRYTT